jgi:N-acetylmuramoyl-L-alanine amidase
MDLAIIVGHNSERQGAVRPDTGETEFVWNGRLARRMQTIAAHYGINARVFYRTPAGGYSAEIRRVYAETDRWGADATVELHFNGADSPEATGTETLTSGTALSLRLAEHVQREMVIALGLRDRGIKTRAGSDRGGMSLISGRAPAILVEPFFGSSAKGQAATDSEAEMEALAHAILRGAAEAMAGFPRADLSESRTLKATAKQRKVVQAGSAAQVAAAVSTGALAAREQIATIPAAEPLVDWLPYIMLGLIAVAFVANVIARGLADDVDAARIDDHEKAVR